MKKFNVVRNESSDVMLNDDERKQLRDSLLSYMEKVPIIPRDDMRILKRSRNGWIVGVLAGVLIAGAGVSFAAQQALPGSMLYPIRIGINDRVRGLFTKNTKTARTVSDSASAFVGSSTELTNSIMEPAVASASTTQTN